LGSVVKFAAINSKIKSLEGKFLTSEQYSKLLQCKNYSEAIRFLKEETSYGEVLSLYNLSEVNRGRLEIILKKYYIQKIGKLRHYFYGDYKKLFNILFMRYEIEDLKVILRGKYIENDKEHIHSLITYESPLNYINYDDLLSAKNIEDIVDKLVNTKYYKYLKPFVSDVEKEGLFRMETSLDFLYFSTIRKFIKRINKEDREILERVNGIYSDLLNVQWISRGKKYYNLTPEVLFNYTIYDGKYLNKEKIKQLCYAKTNEEFFEVIKETPYRDLFNTDDDYLSEMRMLTYLKNDFNKLRVRGEMNISCLIAYLELFQIETRDLISIVENKRYNINFDEAMKYVTVTI
jgi:V/A-type H+-transporting ATPase subunit C